MTHIAVVILNWNGEAMLRRFLPSVVRHSADPGVEVIVADNGSTDNSVRLLQDEFPSVKTILLDRNYGFAEGYNRALEQVEAERFVLLNSDVDVTEGWLQPLSDWLDRHPDTAAVQPKLLKAGPPHHAAVASDFFEYAGACGGFLDKWGYPYCRGRIFDVVERDLGQYDDPMEVHWATGACLMIRSKDWREVGGLDGRFFAHNEEIDLCWRLRILGRRIYCVPESRVRHLGGGTLPQGNPRKTYLNFRNNLTMLYKNLPQERFNSVMRARRLLDLAAAMQSFVTGRFADTKAILRAGRDFRRWRKDFLADRQSIQSRRQLAPRRDLAPLSILWQYYFKGRKKWIQL